MSSIIDFYEILNTAFKDYDPATGLFGNAVIKVAYTEEGVFKVTDANVSPNAGKLLVVTKNEQRPVTDTDVTITYVAADVDEVVEVAHIGVRYEVTKYKAGSSGTTTITIPAGAYDGKAFFIDDILAVGVSDISFDDPFQDVEVYLVCDVGAGLLYGYNTDKYREDLVTAFRSYFTHPPVCVRCSGSGVDSLNPGMVCPDCDGYGYVGNYASGSMLTLRGNDVGVKRLGSDDTEYAMRVWSAKQFIFPNVENIKEHVAYLLNADKDEIFVTEVHGKEIYYEVEYPVTSGSRVDPYGVGIPEILERIRTVSIPVVPAPYIIRYSSGALILWFPAYVDDEHPTLGSGHTKLTNNVLDIPTPSFDPSSFWGGSFVGGSFETYYVAEMRYGDIDSGSLDIVSGSFYYLSGGSVVSKGDPIFSGSTQLYNGDPELSGFFSGLSSNEEYEEKILLDSFWYEVI